MNAALDESRIGIPDGQGGHAMLPRPTAEELSRQAFVRSLKLHLATQVAPGNALAFAAKRVAARDRHDVRRAMERDGYFRFWGALQRNSQEMMWASTQLTVERELDRLMERTRSGAAPLGSLRLDPSVQVPRYHSAVDIHCMPGGYHSEFAADDVSGGAVYDRAVYLYAMGRLGPYNADLGDSVVAWLRRRHPEFAPRRILDLGCTVGHSTLPYVDAFPDAEVHGIDVAAPVLRYAHARAESLGKRVHFSQQNAEATSFPDAHFDLIVSHILIHETSHAAVRRIVRESRRLLAPGGIVLHVETPPFRALPPFEAFMLDWDARNNNEPYWSASHELDPRALAAAAGFDPELAFEDYQPSAFAVAEAERTNLFQCGDFGGSGRWYLWGMRA
jgi:SAM-dependent methyltransferase